MISKGRTWKSHTWKTRDVRVVRNEATLPELSDSIEKSNVGRRGVPEGGESETEPVKQASHTYGKNWVLGSKKQIEHLSPHRPAPKQVTRKLSESHDRELSGQPGKGHRNLQRKSHVASSDLSAEALQAREWPPLRRIEHGTLHDSIKGKEKNMEQGGRQHATATQT